LIFSLYNKKNDMFKFLLIVGIIFYLIYKIGTLFFRAGAASQHRNYDRPTNGTMNGEAAPKSGKKNTKFKGGEYIDYEEIK
jgi:hypothetical protein